MDAKAVVVGSVALACLGLAGWMGYKSFGPQRELRTPEEASAGTTPQFADGEIPEGMIEDEDIGPDGERRLTIDGGELAASMGWTQADPSEGQEFDFPDVDSGDEAAAALLADFEGMVQNVVANDIATPEGGWRPLMETWRSLVMPVLSGNEDAFVRAARELGGRTDPEEEGDPSAASALYTRLAGIFEGSPIDSRRAVVRDVDTDNPRAVPQLPKMPSNFKVPSHAIPMMMMSTETTGPDGTTREMQTIDVPLGGVFPNASDALERGARTLEVWAPAQIAGARGNEPDVGFSTIMVRDSITKRWVPIGMRMRLMSERSRNHVRDTMRARQQED